jgi:hypothetical protein
MFLNRNRLSEKVAFRTAVDRSGRPLDMNFDRKKIESLRHAVRHHFTNERNPTAPEKLRNKVSTIKARNVSLVTVPGQKTKRLGFQELKCAGFIARTDFPHNCLMLLDGNVLLCDSFEHDNNFDDYTAVGRKILKTRNVFEGFREHGDSRKVGLHEVRRCDCQRVASRVSWNLVKGKCAIFPYRLTESSVSVPFDKDLLQFDDWPSWFLAELMQ